MNSVSLFVGAVVLVLMGVGLGAKEYAAAGLTLLWIGIAVSTKT
jgi:hypothetical protein